MNRPARLLILTLAIIAAGCLAAGCAQGANVKKVLDSASSRGTTSDSAAASSPAASSPSPSSRPVFSPTRTPGSPGVTATAQPTVTASASPTAAPSAHATPSQATSGTASSLLWLWILLGALLIAIVVIVATRGSRRRSAFTADWRSQAADASAKGAVLYDAISLDKSQESRESAGAAARWVDIQHRADDLSQQLYRLRDSAPSEEDRLHVADVLASLQAVRSAMEATHAPGGANARQRASMSYLLQSFGQSLRALREPDVYRP